MARLFLRSHGVDTFHYDPDRGGGVIVVTTNMYDPKTTTHRRVEYLFGPNEWEDLKKYVADVGGDFL